MPCVRIARTAVFGVLVTLALACAMGLYLAGNELDVGDEYYAYAATISDEGAGRLQQTTVLSVLREV